MQIAMIHTPVLVVEDDPVVLAMHQTLVESCGYEAVTVRDSEEALEEMARRRFRMVLGDWQMPGMDGLELCRAIRKMDLPYYVYFILVTQKDGKQEYLEAMNAGVDDFVPKPLHRMQLYIRLRVAARILGFQESMDRVRKLVSVCMYCNSIQVEPKSWMKLEEFFETRLERSVTHGICPTCFQEGRGTPPTQNPV